MAPTTSNSAASRVSTTQTRTKQPSLPPSNMDSQTSHASLRQGPRGHACATCRRRKLKCGGERPQCVQCIRGNRAADCVYEENRQTPTHKLSARITELQGILEGYERILANGGLESSSNGLQHAQSYVRGETGEPSNRLAPWDVTSASNSRGAQEIRAQLGPTGAVDVAGSHLTAFLPSGGVRLASLNPPPHPALALVMGDLGGFAESSEEWDVDDIPPGIDRDLLLTTFVTHAHQAHFEYAARRVVESISLSRSHPERPHPCLINAIYLFASHFSRSLSIAQHDARFLARARAGMQMGIKDASQTGDDVMDSTQRRERDRKSRKILDVIQAGSIVSLYLYFKSRVLEGYQMGGAVSRLAIAFGLHQLPYAGFGQKQQPPEPTKKPSWEGDGTFAYQVPAGQELPDPRSEEEWGERIHTFWQVWVVDKYGIMSTGLPCSLPDDDTIQMLKIKTCWPPRMQDFRNNSVARDELESLASMYDGSSPRKSSPDSIVALGMKGVELFAAGLHLKHLKPSQPRFQDQFVRIEKAIDRLASSMPHLTYRENEPQLESLDDHVYGDDEYAPSIAPRMIWPHLLIYTARIVLYGTIANQDNDAYQKRLKAAQDANVLLKKTQDMDSNFHEVAMAPSWKQVAETFIRHHRRLRREGAPAPLIDEYEKEAENATKAMKAICHLFAATAIKSWDSLSQ